MKAAILVESKKPLVVADVDLPTKLEYGQVLVKIFYSGICGAQVNEEELEKLSAFTDFVDTLDLEDLGSK